MDTVLKAAEELNKHLLDSHEYAEYIRARKHLNEFSEYREMVDGFRKKQVAHEIQKINGETIEIDELSLANDYADICLIAECNDFFQAELQLLALIKAAYDKACEGLEVDI